MRGQRTAWGGRPQVLAAVYMGALVATRFNPVIRAFHQRLCGVGKATQVALTACMHKRLTILNAMLKHRTLGGREACSTLDIQDSCCALFCLTLIRVAIGRLRMGDLPIGGTRPLTPDAARLLRRSEPE